MKVALVHDWLTGMRGGEKVLAEFVSLFPEAHIFALLWDRGKVVPEIEARIRRTSFLQHLPGAMRGYRYYLPLFPLAVRSLDLSDYDLVVSSHHAVAKGVCVSEGAVHISYVHTPMRYLWDTGADYFRIGRALRLKRAALAAFAPWVRAFDRRTASRVDFFIANSENVRRRIRRFWSAEAEVIYPPVDTDFFTPGLPGVAKPDYYLAVSPLEPYKRIDLAVEAFSGGGRRLLVAGKGSLLVQLRRRARPPVEFLGQVDDQRLRELYRNCRALIFPGVEDFGMVPVEAQACGRPVVAFGEGGAAETVHDGVTGVHFHQQTPGALMAAVERLERMAWDTSSIRNHSLAFSKHQFRSRMEAFFRKSVPALRTPDEHCYSKGARANL